MNIYLHLAENYAKVLIPYNQLPHEHEYNKANVNQHLVSQMWFYSKHV